ncbi:MAG TPA: ATP-binding cassette domain-containing protein [Balneolales bacterium]|nr:ATP-binding cassette domain-containing protein [Balneolales bacterium]
MALINIKDVSIGFGGPLLLDEVNFQIEEGEKVCLLGRNGAGKSTLLKLIAGDLNPSVGAIDFKNHIKIARLEQKVPHNVEGTVFDIVANGLEKIGTLLTDYHRLTHELSVHSNSDLLNQLDKAQRRIESVDGWQMNQKIEEVISRMNLNADADFETLSGGMKRRVLLAKALVTSPDILLLDEPTNHLDIDSIDWLENYLQHYSGTILFVTHDRVFLRKLATRIVELERGRLFDWECDYDTFLKRKEAYLESEEQHQAKFDKKLKEEEIWLRKGIKARRTRNEGRVRALLKMREERKARRERQGTVSMQVNEANRSGNRVIEAKNISFSYDEKPIVKNFSTTITRGDKIGIIGSNGSGKTTLLRILLGKLQPDQGNVRLGTNLEIVYFDQLRQQLDNDKTVRENVSEGKDTITINGQNKHIISYLKDFLFTPDRSLSPVSVLSGGERNRVLLARLFTKPSNVIVMDEPTNDLDIETLELLEELLLDYPGTLIMVSHDREFLNNVVTSTIVFEGVGNVKEYVGGYDDWLRQRKDISEPPKKKAEKSDTKHRKKGKKKTEKKLSYKQKKELEKIPQQIEELEQQQKVIYEKLGDPEFYQKNGDEIVDMNDQLETIEKALTEAYDRWEELEALNSK